MAYIPKYIIKRELHVPNMGTKEQTLAIDNIFYTATNEALKFDSVTQAKVYYNLHLGDSKGLAFIVGDKGGMYYAKNGRKLSGIN